MVNSPENPNPIVRDNFGINQDSGKKIYEEIARRSTAEHFKSSPTMRPESEPATGTAIEKIKKEKNIFGKEEAELVLEALKKGLGETWALDARLDNYLYGFLCGRGKKREKNEGSKDEYLEKWKDDYSKFITAREKYLNKPGRPGILDEKRSWIFFDTKHIKDRKERGELKYRLYLNPKSQNVVEVYNRIIGELLKDKSIAFQTKTLNVASIDKTENIEEAFDKIVLYSDDDSVDKIVDFVATYVSENEDKFNEKALPFSAKLKDKKGNKISGVGMAFQDDKNTFTEMQSELISKSIFDLINKIESVNEKIGYVDKLKKTGYVEVAEWLENMNNLIDKYEGSNMVTVANFVKLVSSNEKIRDGFIKYFPDLYNINALKAGVDTNNIAFLKAKKTSTVKSYA